MKMEQDYPNTYIQPIPFSTYVKFGFYCEDTE